MQRFMRCALLLAVLLMTSANSCEDEKRHHVKVTDYSGISAPIPEPMGIVLFGVGVIIVALALRHRSRR